MMRPHFFVTAEANAGLVKMLPVLRDGVRALLGERRLTMVLDRGGWRTPSSTPREEYALDALVEYATEPDDPTRQVPNPKWNELDGQLRQARAALKTLPAEYGLKALLNSERRRPTMRGFKIAHGKLGKQILEAVNLNGAVDRIHRMLHPEDQQDMPERPFTNVVKGLSA